MKLKKLFNKITKHCATKKPKNCVKSRILMLFHSIDLPALIQKLFFCNVICEICEWIETKWKHWISPLDWIETKWKKNCSCPPSKHILYKQHILCLFQFKKKRKQRYQQNKRKIIQTNSHNQIVLNTCVHNWP